LCGADPPKTGDLWHELDLLARVVSPAHLDLLQGKRGSKLEELLAEYVRRQGPQRGVWWSGHEREPALEILRRMNGDRLTDVVNGFLTCDDRYGRLDALRWAMKRPNAATFKHASERAVAEELWDGVPLEQNNAMELLAVHAQWEAVCQGIRRWGLETHLPLVDNRLAPRLLGSEAVDLRKQVAENPTPGNVIALAFIGCEQDAARLHAVLESSDPKSKLAHACVIGLELLGDDSDRGVSLVAKQLDVQHHSATRMLSAAGTPAAWKALFEDLKVKFDHINALNLLNLSDHAAEVAKLVVEKLPHHSHFASWEFLRILVCRLRRPELKQQLLADRWLRETFHREAVAAEGNSWVTGSKASAIECLAEVKPAAAFESARRALATRESHDRERYPYLLFDIDPGRAIGVLLEQLVNEKPGRVRFAIGRVLAQVDLEGQLLPLFNSADAATRAAACFAAGWAKDAQRLEGPLRMALDDLAEPVIREAMAGLDRFQRRAICNELADRAIASKDLAVKWLYVDALVDLADPGEKFRTPPAVVRSACKDLSPLVCKFVNDRVKKRRKELHDKLDRENKDE
jgi:hypothetical protein